MPVDSITLYEALDMCIEQAKNKNGIDWIITGDAISDSVDRSGLPGNIYDHFDKVTGTESHLFTEICICIEGNLAMQLGQHIIDINEGKACLVLPEVLHAELPKKDENYLALWICASFDTIALHLSGKNKDNGHFYTLDGYTVKSSPEYNLTLANIKEEADKKYWHYLEIVKLDVMKLLISVFREIGKSGAEKTETRPWKETIVLHVQDFIKKHYNRSVRLSDISQELCISPNYVNTIFRSVTGKTIIRYAEEYKTDKARELLSMTEYSINSIAAELGYYDQYHFSKIFKKETGFTPSQFRKLFKSNRHISLKGEKTNEDQKGEL